MYFIYICKQAILINCTGNLDYFPCAILTFATCLHPYHGFFFFQDELNIVPDGTVSLDTFCAFQQTLNTPSETDPLHHDYAIMITRFVITKHNNTFIFFLFLQCRYLFWGGQWYMQQWIAWYARVDFIGV